LGFLFSICSDSRCHRVEVTRVHPIVLEEVILIARDVRMYQEAKGEGPVP